MAKKKAEQEQAYGPFETFPNKQPYHVEGVLGPYRVTGGDNRRIVCTVTVPFTRTADTAVGVMIDYYVDLTEADRGVDRPALPDGMRFEIDKKAVTHGRKKQSGVTPKEMVLTIECAFSRAVLDGLCTIAEASPSTMILHQTENELPLNAPDEDGEDQMEI